MHYRRSGCGIAFGLPPGSAEDRRDSGNQFAWAERLGQIVVSAEFQAQDAVEFVPFCRKHQHRRANVCSDFLQHVKTLLVRQHDIQHDEFVVAFNCGPPPRSSRMDYGNGKALRLQVVCYQPAEVAVVVHYQKTWVVSLRRTFCVLQGPYLREPKGRALFNYIVFDNPVVLSLPRDSAWHTRNSRSRGTYKS